MRHTVVAMVEIQTDDERLDPSRISVGSIAKAASLRAGVIANLPHNLTRVICVLPVEVAKVLMVMHDDVAAEVGLPPDRPPPGYVPPTRE